MPVAEDVQALEERLEQVRSDPGKVEQRQILEWWLARARGERKSLTLDSKLTRRIYMLSARLVGRNDAEDVAHEAFVSLFRWLEQQPPSSMLAMLNSDNGVLRLLYKITSCRAYDHLRRKTAQLERLTAQGEERELTARAVAYPISSEIELVDLAYAQLTPVQRVAHVLHYFYGFTDADLEETLQWKRATSRSRVHRANLAFIRALRNNQ